MLPEPPQMAIQSGRRLRAISTPFGLPTLLVTCLVYFNDGPAQIRTGYSSNPLFGLPIVRTWNVAVHSPVDLLSIPFSGPATAYYWQAYAQTHIVALKGQTVTALAGGTVHTLYADCTVGSPTASIKQK